MRMIAFAHHCQSINNDTDYNEKFSLSFIIKGVILMNTFVNLTNEFVVGNDSFHGIFNEKLFKNWLKLIFIKNHFNVLKCSISVSSNLINDSFHSFC